MLECFLKQSRLITNESNKDWFVIDFHIGIQFLAVYAENVKKIKGILKNAGSVIY